MFFFISVLFFSDPNISYFFHIFFILISFCFHIDFIKEKNQLLFFLGRISSLKSIAQLMFSKKKHPSFKAFELWHFGV